jgi:hypothetical protein
MGPAIVSKPDPSHPLRRRENYIELPKSIYIYILFLGYFIFILVPPFIRSHRISSIPKFTEQEKTKLKPSKNFIKENITKIINSLPINSRRYIVSDRKGNKFLINGSGLQKDFINKKVTKIVYSLKNLFLDRITEKFQFIFKHVKHLINH